MKPFVLWLEKEQIDELISVLITSKNNSKDNINKELFDVNDLAQLAEKLINQNNKLLHILNGIKPLTEYENSRVEAVGIKQKCNSYKQLMDDFKIHCSIHGKVHFKDGKIPPCDDCPIS